MRAIKKLNKKILDKVYIYMYNIYNNNNNKGV